MVSKSGARLEEEGGEKGGAEGMQRWNNWRKSKENKGEGRKRRKEG